MNKTKGEISSLPAKELEFSQIKALKSDLAQEILKLLSKKSAYPMELAKQLDINEQKIYYHIRNLEKARIIEVTKTETIHGTNANYYELIEPAFVIRFKEFQKTPNLSEIDEIDEQPQEFLEPFIENGKFNSLIIVGSPEPHGPEQSRSKDGYYGMDLALFLGTFINHIQGLNVKLDTEARTEDLKNNLILIGGPVVNKVTEKINDKLPIKFDRAKNWSVKSSLSNKSYFSDQTGIIVKIKNPFNPKKSILLISGKRHAGTRAVIITFIKYFKKIFEGNNYNKKIIAKVVEGIDSNSDGIIDDVIILE